MRKVGRGVLGAVVGVLFGLFVSLDLFLFGALPLDSVILGIVPVVGLVGGAVLAVTQPMGRKKPWPMADDKVPPEAAAAAVADDTSEGVAAREPETPPEAETPPDPPDRPVAD